MMEWYLALVIVVLVAMLGALMHVIVPPMDENYQTISIKLVAGAVVGVVLFLFGMDPRNMTIPSTELGTWFISVIALGYVGLELLQKLLTKYSQTPIPPIPPVPPEPPGT